jgi:hypothetical protein
MFHRLRDPFANPPSFRTHRHPDALPMVGRFARDGLPVIHGQVAEM